MLPWRSWPSMCLWGMVICRITIKFYTLKTREAIKIFILNNHDWVIANFKNVESKKSNWRIFSICSYMIRGIPIWWVHKKLGFCSSLYLPFVIPNLTYLSCSFIGVFEVYKLYSSLLVKLVFRWYGDFMVLILSFLLFQGC